MTSASKNKALASRELAAASMIRDITAVFERLPQIKAMSVTFSSYPSEMLVNNIVHEFDLMVNDVDLIHGYSADPIETQSDAEVMLLTSAQFHTYLLLVAGGGGRESCELNIQFQRSLLPVTSDHESAIRAFEYICPELANEFLQDEEPFEIKAPDRARPMAA